MALSWRGAEIAAKIEGASLLGVERTMADAVAYAKRNHGWENRTGTEEGSLRIVDDAHSDGAAVTGTWGSADVNYTIFLEFLAGEIMGDTGWTRTRNGGSPFLRPSADANYPKLRGYIAAAYRGELK